MIIHNATKISSPDVADYSWRKLAQFNNVGFTSELISHLHGLDPKQSRNARKQAEQIQYCLIQAKEYFESSRVVSLATKPVLLYYCVMSLALAEILVKQTGDSRLSKLRENHNCHGLSLTLQKEPLPTDSLFEATNQLIAKIQTNQFGEPKGTFEVWRRSARELPIVGYWTQRFGAGNTSSFRTIFTAEDIAPPVLGRSGISLRSCLINLPYMADTLARWGDRLEMVRAKISVDIPEGKPGEFTIVIHPASSDLIDRFSSLFVMEPEYINILDITDLPSGLIMRWPHTRPLKATLPHAMQMNVEDCYFTCSTENLGEFGYLYCALHILGNFARYYPDVWIKHIDVKSPLANATEELCIYALQRLPLLTLSELSRIYHIPD